MRIANTNNYWREESGWSMDMRPIKTSKERKPPCRRQTKYFVLTLVEGERQYMISENIVLVFI